MSKEKNLNNYYFWNTLHFNVSLDMHFLTTCGVLNAKLLQKLNKNVMKLYQNITKRIFSEIQWLFKTIIFFYTSKRSVDLE